MDQSVVQAPFLDLVYTTDQATLKQLSIPHNELPW